MQGKVKQSAESKVYVGIDVSKGQLDVYLHPCGDAFKVTNDKTGFKALKRRLRDLDVDVVVVEATGKYHRDVHRSLSDNGFSVAVLNPYRSRKFSDCLGQLAKTDQIDARVLALFGEALKPKATQPASKTFQYLQELMSGLEALKASRTAHKNRLGSASDRVLKRQLRLLLQSLDKRIKAVEMEIIARMKSDRVLVRRYQILTSIPGIGPTIALTMLVRLSELGTLTSKQIAALVGVAPMNWDSGQYRGTRHIRGGRAEVRTSMYMGALAVARCKKSELRTFYDRLLANGKTKKVALTALIRKLAVLANTLIKQDRKWQPIAP